VGVWQRGRMSVPLLLCVPGLGLDQRAWAPTLAALGREQGASSEVVLLPGYGVRPSRDDAVDPVSLGRRLAAERLVGGRSVVGPVVLAGHSASAQVVAEAARAAPPGVVAGLVLIGPTTDVRGRSWPSIAGRWLRTAAHEPPRQVPTLVGSYSRVGLGSMLRTMDATRRHDIRAPLRELGLPVLALRGRHDRICPPGWTRQLAGATSLSVARSLSVGAHMVPLTHGPEVAGALWEFLETLG
jgi:pimeloyl-ACP methyl ester carboxylesterase